MICVPFSVSILERKNNRPSIIRFTFLRKVSVLLSECHALEFRKTQSCSSSLRDVELKMTNPGAE